MSAPDTFIKTILQYQLVQKGDKILVAVSGGPDSVALLSLLAGIRKEYNLALAVVHLDHMLRRDSGRDSCFVQDLAKRFGFDFYSSKINVALRARGQSLEEVARNCRLDYFLQVARRTSADKIALGHTLDDQAETVLMRILRGTGLYGLSGIAPKRVIKGVTFIRPLIETRRKAIESFLRRKRIRYRLDSTNKEETYFRNRIRHRLMPLLKKEYNSNIEEVLANLAESSSFDYDFLCIASEKFLSGNHSRITLKRFNRLHPALRRILLRSAYAKLAGDTRKLTLQHIKEIEHLIASRPPNSIVDLPKGISAIKKGKIPLFFKRKIARNT